MIGVKLKEDFDVQEVAFFNLSKCFNQTKTKTCPIPIWILFGLRLVLSKVLFLYFQLSNASIYIYIIPIA
jgi:hypothetical protein